MRNGGEGSGIVEKKPVEVFFKVASKEQSMKEAPLKATSEK